MQRVLHPFLTLLVLLAGLALSPATMAAKSDPLAVVKAYMDGWNRHDPNLAAMNMDYEVEYYDVTVGESQYGVVPARDNVIKFFMQALPDLKWKMVGEPLVTKDAVAFQWVFSGTNTGAWSAETPATGKPVKFEGVSFVRIKDGKIAYQGDYYDALGFNKQLGW